MDNVNILDDVRKPLFFSDKEIFTKIWLNPREVFSYIHQNSYDKYVIILLILAGISGSFDRAVMRDMGDDMSLFAIVGLCIIIGGLLGWISYYIYAALTSWTGKWLDGQGDTSSILMILAYATIPSVLALLLLIPQIGIYGNELFKSEGDIMSGGIVANAIFYGTAILEVILGIYSIVLSVIGVSEVQQFGIGKAILNLLLPILVIVVPLVAIAFIFIMF